MKPIRLTLLCGAMVLSAASILAQQPVSTPAPAPLGDAWGHVEALPLHAHMHVAADHGGRTCYFIAADNQTLTCGRHNGSATGQHVFPRAEVKSVKLTRYGISTLGGAAIGMGIGAAIGFATTSGRQDQIIDVPGVARAACTVIGGVGGAAVGGPTDMFRGPTIYRRIPQK